MAVLLPHQVLHPRLRQLYADGGRVREQQRAVIHAKDQEGDGPQGNRAALHAAHQRRLR